MAIIQLEQIDQRNGPINRLLHSDALQLVFDALLPPPGFLSISIQATPNRPWILQLRTFKAVVLVCKRWYTLCLRYLYGDICLRYVGQIAALVRTVRTEPLTFAPLVRSLRVICYIPNEHMRVCAEGLKYLLDICSSLQEVSFEELVAHDSTFLTLRDMVEGNFPRLASSVQKFSLFNSTHDYKISARYAGPHMLSPILLDLISTVPTLVSLCVEERAIPEQGGVDISLPHLRSLRIYCTGYNFYLPAKWHLPKLVDFSIRSKVEGVSWPGIYPSGRGITGCSNTTKFFHKYGKQLVRLDLGYNRIYWHTIAATLTHCPRLSHFVFTIPVTRNEEQLNVKPLDKLPPFVDIFVPPKAQHGTAEWARTTILHRAEHIRLLDRALLPFVPDLPTLVAPEYSLKVGYTGNKPNVQKAFDHYGLTILHTVDAVWMSDLLLGDDAFNPAFYNWSQTDQIRKSPRGRKTATTTEYDSDMETDTSYDPKNENNNENNDEDEDEGEDDEMDDANKKNEEQNREPEGPQELSGEDTICGIQLDEAQVLWRFSNSIQNE